MRLDDKRYPHPSTPAVTAIMRGNRKRDTNPELLLASEIHRRGMRFRRNIRLCLGALTVRPDVVFTRRKVAVFVDGCFWHSCPQHGTSPRANSSYWRAKLMGNVDRDVRVNEALMLEGWCVVRVWEHERPADAADRISLLLQDRTT